MIVIDHWHCSREHRNRISHDLNKLTGFIYAITNLTNGKIYFGRKTFWDKKTAYRKAKSSGRRLKKHYHTESDWRGYRGSSDGLTADIDALGWDSFHSEIIGVFEGKSGVTTAEATIVLATGGLLAPERCYNRQCPALRGYVRLKDSDIQEVAKVLLWASTLPLYQTIEV